MAALRLCHLKVLWVEEAYPLAAAWQMHLGRALYRDLWFDKPPAFAWFYGLFGAQEGLPLRLAGAAFVLLTGAVAAWAARRLWGRGEGWAAALTVFFFTFDFHSSVLSLTPDLLAVPLHLGVLAFAATGNPLAAGLCAGFALWLNTKAALFLAAALLWQWKRALPLAAGFLLPQALLAAMLHFQGALPHYWQQVWLWGAQYSRDTWLTHPVSEGLRKTAGWLGFHAALLVGAALAMRGLPNRERIRWSAVLCLSLAAAWMGLRFFPRYYFHLLPPMLLTASLGLAHAGPRTMLFAVLLLAVPAARFGPRYLLVATGAPWNDLAMERDSRAVLAHLPAKPGPGDSLLVWGYRPELYVLSRLPAATRFLDSQPLNGILADRHLTQSAPSFPALAARLRQEVLRGPKPRYIVDGLGPYNPALAFFRTPGFAEWNGEYELAGSTNGCRVYRRLASPPSAFQAGARF